VVDFWEFLAHSEWPIVVGGGIWLLRAPLAAMMSRINPTKVDAWGFKAEFEKSLDKVESLTTQNDSKDEFTPRLENVPEEEVRKIVLAPQGTILDSWRILELTMRQMHDAKHPRVAGSSLWHPPSSIEKAATELGLSPNEIESLLVLRKLRDDVAHSSDAPITWSDANRFKEAIDRLLSRMAEAAKAKDTSASN
jgi:hypothetical protein